jgi:hypothetical protein
MIMKLTIVPAVLALGIVVVGSAYAAAPTVTIGTPEADETFDFNSEIDVDGDIEWSTPPSPEECYPITVVIKLVCPRTMEQIDLISYNDCVDGGDQNWSFIGSLTSQAEADPLDPDPTDGFCVIVEVDGGSDEVNVFIEDLSGGCNSFERYEGPAFGMSFLGRVSLSLGGF